MLQNTSAGLSEAEAKARLAKVGENRLRGKKGASVAAMFFSQFKDLMILILAAATLISVLMGEGTEAITIIIIVLMNATMGFLQEYRTEKTLEALKELSAPTARVRRSGRELEVGARTVVPGDVLLFEAGDKVAADCTLQTGVQVSCNEAMLTGESLPAAKQPGDRLYMGCIVMTGRGEGVVTATGMETEMGKIAGMMETAGEEPTPLQLKLKQLGRFVAVACVTICLAVGFLGFLQGNDFLEMLLTGISLAVAAIPEGLPAIVTITLALSVNRILRRGAVIRKLHAVETLGCAGVICTDKTGTITQNKMTVQRIWVPGRTLNVSGSGYRAQGAVEENGRPVQAARDAALGRLCEAASLCTTAHITRAKDVYDVMGDPTEVAVLVAAAKAGVTKEALLQQYTVIGENPFDAARKRMSVTVSGPGGVRLLCKGAPDMLLARCTHIATPAGPRLLAPRDRADINAACARMAGEALRAGLRGKQHSRRRGGKAVLLGPDGHAGPAPARGAPRRTAVPRGRHQACDDHRRLQGNSAGHCPGRGHRPRGGRRALGHGAGRAVRFGACRAVHARLCLRPRFPRPQASHRARIQGGGPGCRNDRRRRHRAMPPCPRRRTMYRMHASKGYSKAGGRIQSTLRLSARTTVSGMVSPTGIEPAA